MFFALFLHFCSLSYTFVLAKLGWGRVMALLLKGLTGGATFLWRKKQLK